MNWLDIVLLSLLGIAAFSGFVSGLVKAVLSLIGLIAGVILAGRNYVALAGQLTFITDETAARVTAFILIFLVTIIIATLLGIALHKLISALLLGWLNRLGGAFFGLLLGALFLSVVLTLWVTYIGPSGPIIESATASFLLDKLPVALTLLPADFSRVQEFFH